MKSLLMILIAMLLPGALTMAQAETMLALGETVSGEITIDDYEALYSFEGQAGQIIRALMTPQNPDFGGYHTSWWSYPALLLLDAQKRVIAELHTHESAALIHELPADGKYYLIATGWYGRVKENVGKFDLLLEELVELPFGVAVECEVSSDAGKHYALRAEGDFAITYRYSSGDFRPQISVNVIADDPYSCGMDTSHCASDADFANLHKLASLSGAWLTSGTMAVAAKAAAGLYIIEVGKEPWSYFYADKPTSASFTLEVNRLDH